MNINDLLNTLDDPSSNPPPSCQTCIHMATHEKCDGCLESVKMSTEPGREHLTAEYNYHHWQPGNWMRQSIAYQYAGKRSIVIGGAGEAEVNASDTPEETSKNLHYVACECGYMCGGLRKSCAHKGVLPVKKNISIWVDGSKYKIYWTNDRLTHINRETDAGVEVRSWPDYDIIDPLDLDKIINSRATGQPVTVKGVEIAA